MSFFKFNYMPESELETKKVDLTPGDASFKVVSIFDKRKDGQPLTTMSGEPKLTVSFSMIDCNGSQGLVYDDLTPKTAWKIKALLDSIGLPHLYNESGTLDTNEITGCTGKCVIELKKSDGYPDRISIKKYIKRDAILSAQSVKKDYSDELGDPDQIPF